MADLFSPNSESVRHAIAASLAADPLPPDKNGALIIHGDYDSETGVKTMTAVLAERVGDHWVLSQDVELHDAHWRAGVNVAASW